MSRWQGQATPARGSPRLLSAALPRVPSAGHVVAHPRAHGSSGKQVHTIDGSGGAHGLEHVDVVRGAESEYRWRSEARIFNRGQTPSR